MRKSERKSTIENSKNLQVELNLREQKRRQRALRQQNKSEVVELSSFVNESDKDKNNSETDSSGEVFVNDSDEYWFDSVGQELTGTSLASPPTPFPALSTDPETWSVSVNRFSSDSNLLDSLRREAIDSVFDFISDLENNSESNKEELPVNNPPLSQPNTSSSSNSTTSTVREQDCTMDEDTFYAHSIELEDHTLQIKSLIGRFNKDTVDLMDLGSFRDELQKIFNRFNDFEKAYITLKNKLDRRKPSDVPKLEQIKQLYEKYQKLVIDNEVAVKKQLRELQTADTMSHSEASEKLAIEKIEMKIKHAVKKYKDLTKIANDIGEVDVMSEHSIRETLVESKDWKKDLKAYRDSKEALDLEKLSIEINPDVEAQLESAYNEMVTAVTNKITELNKADKDLGLYALIDNKVKSTIQYPDPFSGALGENVFKFVKEFKDAIQSDQIRKADEVRTLMKYLKGNAKLTIGEHHISLQKALDQLSDNYGSPRLIVDKYLRDFEKSLGQVRQWGKHGSKERVDAINKTLDFLRNLESLVTDHPDHLKSEIYSSSTLSLITKGMPYDYSKRLNERCSHKDPYDHWFTTVFDILEEAKSTNLSALSTGIGAAKSYQKDSDTPSSKSNSLKHNGHDCSKSNTCKEKWDLLGCSHLYKLSTVEERETFLRERRACFRCGKTPFMVKNQGKHYCSWKNGKMDARCCGKVSSGARCWKGAALCIDHPNNASDILKDWLTAQRIKFTVSVVVSSSESLCVDEDRDYYQQLRSEIPINRHAEKVDYRPKDRASLQSGESAQMMDDDQIHDFFTSDMRRIKSKAKVHKIPDGDAVFILTVVKGRQGPVMTFVDCGANVWLAEEGIPEREFISVKLDHGPIPLSVAGGNVTYASGEYASLLPLADGSYQCVRGLTLKQVTGTMPELNLVPVFEQIKASSECADNDRIKNLSIPKRLGGKVQMLIGIKYQNIFPKVLHSFPSGLTVFESRLMPATSGALACIGGPISCLNQICDTVGASSTLSYMANLIQNMNDFTKLEFFPLDRSDFEFPRIDTMSCESCGSFLVQSEIEKFFKYQDAGLDTSYKCPKCRACEKCKKGAGQELLSMKEEFQQQLIEDSVTIDDDLGQAIAFLAFLSDPSESLGESEHIAIKRLQNVCKKYSSDPNVKDMILKGFQKLIDKGHIIMYDDLTKEDKKLLESSPGYTIPWDVGFKQESVTTPARPTFDASSKSQGGLSLNDNLAKGRVNLVNMVNMVLNWLVGPIALTGDISQFYNCVLLRKEHWRYQRVVWYRDLDPKNELVRGIVQTLIYGVRCVSAQTEFVKTLLEERIRSKAVSSEDIAVADFIKHGWYVDDGGTSVRSISEAHSLINGTNKELATVKMFVKGWSVSFERPPPEVSDDGTSVAFAGLKWYPEVDSFSLKIQPLHFGKKSRGRYSEKLERYDGSFGKTVDEFVPKDLSRRMSTSVVARIFDVPGFLAPLMLKLKYDLRKILEADSSWDNSLSDSMRSMWIQNFKFIEDMRDVLYVRCKIPENALRSTVRIWILCDASPCGGIIVSAYSGHERGDGSWSSDLLFAKNLLCPRDWTTPRAELHALSSLSNMVKILGDTLGNWIEILRAGSDSTIAISWAIYEKVRLHIFQRLRVANIRNKLSFEELYHVDGKENVSDIGTRPDLLRPEDILPGSAWMVGKDWMRLSIDEALESGIIKNVEDIVLDNESKKQFKEGVLLESSLNFASYSATVNDTRKTFAQKVIEREEFSQYIYPPLKRSFPSFVRITGYVLLAVRKFKKGVMLARSRKNIPITDAFMPKSVELPDPKFSMFNVNYPLSSSSSKFKLDARAISLSLEYIYQKTTSEVLHFNDKKFVDKVGIMSDGILYCKSRLTDDQSLRIVGGLENVIDLETFTGVSFKVPVIDKFSPLALSIVNHLHYTVNLHKGVETTHRMALQYVRILGGRSLFKMVRDDCSFCQKELSKHIKQIMGPLSNQQLSITPIFFYTLVDAWGPLRAYVPPYQRATRTGDRTHDVYMLVFACAATGMLNCQIMEGGKNTACVLDTFNRFFHEAVVPRVCFIDRDSALVKVLSEAQLEIVSNDGIIAKQRGIEFQTCCPQGHNAHGRIEARIKMIQEAFSRSEMKSFKLHSMGWQTFAKTVEHQINSIPLGFLQHQDDTTPMLRILTPNFLKLNAAANRSPKDLFTLPNSGEDLMSRVQDAYKLFFKIWNNDYVPLIAKRQKWHDGDDDLVPNDIVYFKLKDSLS